MIIEAIKRRKHIFVEKPLALTDEECQEIAKSLKRHPVKLMVGFNRRFSSLTNLAKQELLRTSGPKMVSCRINSKKLPLDHWTNSIDEGGGMLLGEACHFFDLFYYLLEEEPISVFASSLNNDNPTALYSNFSVNIEFEKGSIANLIYTTLGSLSLPKERIEIFYGGCAIIIDDFKAITILNKKRYRKKFSHAQKGLHEELTCFVSYLRTGESAVPTVDDGIRATRCALKSMESIRQKTCLSLR
jgi:polar amino acid transport system substrate-binding protein